MVIPVPWAGRFFQGTDTMLGQLRTLFFGFVLLWPVFGFWAVWRHAERYELQAAVVATVLLEVWLYRGYRRQRFPAWSWVPEGVCVAAVAAASDYGPTIVMCFLWVNFRALYGRLRQKLLAAGVLAAMMVTGVVLFDADRDGAASMLITALIALTVNHVLALGSSARDRTAAREATLASAGAGLVASTTRAEAMDVTLGAALSMDRAVSGALICTGGGPRLHVVAGAGHVGEESVGWIAGVTILPDATRAALEPGGYLMSVGEDAAAIAAALRLPPRPVMIAAPLSAYGDVFGLLVLALDRRPADDLTASVTTLAGEAALTLDQLLSRSRLSIVVEHSPDALMLAAEAGSIRFANPAAAAVLGCDRAELIGRNLWSLVHPDDRAALADPPPASTPGGRSCRIRAHDGVEWADVEAMVEQVTEHDGSRSLVFTARDVSEQVRLELELRHAQKLESVGRLAAGIAHEINTPIQFVGDNVRFLNDAFADLGRLYAAYQELVSVAQQAGDVAAAVQEAQSVADDVDVEFVMDEVPVAISQTLEGINRVAGIVRAMKAFGHPGTDEKTQADLNESIRNTLVVANNEIKYVADVETDLADLPSVYCHLGDINQIVLNLVVNAAHAIAAAGPGRGTVTVRTFLDGADAVIQVGDTGTGVDPEIADKLFDPFFTTKEVGTGTGQGLALVRTLVTDRHGGTIDFTSELGVGTTFSVRLPVGVAGGSEPAGELTEAAR
ncbi:two-component system sensor histidine kinase NtrB [Jidongwangia harbinensis]|uniref:two-component system sensor histidine kinase NtrB n=1 Tax=Jidongwangia harbinensis TaxID=2878561 RepID=UPI001CDA451F|nr:ATP-binding protein [Jidongwangia harbinensis]MCA2213179.1 PAS domain S-box protein [Jidongwangia harbinensis]